MRRFMRGLFLVFLTGLSPFLLAQENTHLANPDVEQIFRNPSIPVEIRVNKLVSAMTLEEKSLQMQNQAPAIERLGIPAYNLSLIHISEPTRPY